MTTTETAAPRMSGWERWAKRFAKAFLWMPVYFGTAYWLGFEPTWQLLAVVVVNGFWSNVLDSALPTGDK